MSDLAQDSGASQSDATKKRRTRVEPDTLDIPGWTTLCSDMSWDDYYGMWCKRAKDGSYFVLRWQNLLDAGGRDFEDTPFECDVMHVDFSNVLPKDIVSALESSGYKLLADGTIVQEYDSDVIADNRTYAERVIVECMVQYGSASPLESFTGSKRHKPANIRGKARRCAERLMRDADALETQLSRPVNRMGTSARDYGGGRLVLAPGEAAKRGGVMLPQSMFRKCKFSIFMPSHYRADGSCMCDDPAHRRMMIAEWEYKEKDFADIPLRPNALDQLLLNLLNDAVKGGTHADASD